MSWTEGLDVRLPKPLHKLIILLGQKEQKWQGKMHFPKCILNSSEMRIHQDTD